MAKKNPLRMRAEIKRLIKVAVNPHSTWPAAKKAALNLGALALLFEQTSRLPHKRIMARSR